MSHFLYFPGRVKKLRHKEWNFSGVVWCGNTPCTPHPSCARESFNKHSASPDCLGNENGNGNFILIHFIVVLEAAWVPTCTKMLCFGGWMKYNFCTEIPKNLS